jgi:mannose-1-phosphate guanylyltransferase
VLGNVLVDATAVIEEGAVLGPNVVVGPNCIIKKGTSSFLIYELKGCRLRDTVVLSGSIIGENSWISESVIGWNCRIGRWVRIEGVSVCGEDVQIKDELFIN